MPKLKLKNIDQSGAQNGDVAKYKVVSGSWVPDSDISGSGGISAVSGTNLGSGGQVFKGVLASDTLSFRSLVATGSELSVSESANELIISSSIASGLNVGGAKEVYLQNSDVELLNFRTLDTTGSALAISQSANTLVFSGSLSDGTNVGGGAEVFSGTQAPELATFRTLVETGSVSVTQVGDAIVISSSFATGSNVGGGNEVLLSVDSPELLNFRTLVVTGSGLSISQSTDTLVFSASIVVPSSSLATGSNVGGGFEIFSGTQEPEILTFRTLVATGSVSISQVGDTLVLSASDVSGSSGGNASGSNVGSGVELFKNVSPAENLNFRTLISGPRVSFSQATDTVTISSSLTTAVVAQEKIATQNVSGVDTNLSAALLHAPVSTGSVLLFLNGIQQKQGSSAEYLLTGSDNKTIRWLADTGTALPLDTQDVLDAYYYYNNTLDLVSASVRQESITAQDISGSDTNLSDTLSFIPQNTSSVLLFLNGIQQGQGVGRDYVLGGTNNQTITWLGSTGTAVILSGSDSLEAYYFEDTGIYNNIVVQEQITTENITSLDYDLSQELSLIPQNPKGVLLFLNGVQQEQGIEKDYILSGEKHKKIRWLADTGTAVDLSTTDTIDVYYLVSDNGGAGSAGEDWALTGSTLSTKFDVVVGEESEAKSKGEDVHFFVSGTVSSGSAGDKVAVFGGSVRISGALAVGSESLILSGNDVRARGTDLTFYDQSNPSGKTLSQLSAGTFFKDFTQTETAQTASGGGTVSVILGSFQVPQTVSASAVVMVQGWVTAGAFDGFNTYSHMYEAKASAFRRNSGLVSSSAPPTLDGAGGTNGLFSSPDLSASADTPSSGITTLYFKANAETTYGDAFFRTLLNWVLTTSSLAL